MSDYAYTDPDPYAQAHYDAPQRTSLAAVFGFIISLVGCCLPVGFLGALLGLFGLIGIGRSNGRVGGKGLAIAAVILGLLNTVMWVGGLGVTYMGLGQVTNTWAPIVSDAFEESAQGDPSELRSLLAPSAAGDYTDEELLAFAQAVEDEFGTPVSTPASVGELIGKYMESAEAMASFQGQQVIPIPAQFDNGPVMIALMQAAPGSAPGSIQVPVRDIIVADNFGNTVALSEYRRLSPDGDPDQDSNQDSNQDSDADTDADGTNDTGSDEGP